MNAPGPKMRWGPAVVLIGVMVVGGCPQQARFLPNSVTCNSTDDCVQNQPPCTSAAVCDTGSHQCQFASACGDGQTCRDNMCCSAQMGQPCQTCGTTQCNGNCALPPGGCTRFCWDGDNDGYCVMTRCMEAAPGQAAPPWRSDCRGPDCNDDDPNVHPGQSQYFSAPSGRRSAAMASPWDYDCSGAVEADSSVTLACGGCPSCGIAQQRPVNTPTECGQVVKSSSCLNSCGGSPFFTCARVDSMLTPKCH